MRNVKFTWLCLTGILFGLLLTACGSDITTTPVTTTSSTTAISGKITTNATTATSGVTSPVTGTGSAAGSTSVPPTTSTAVSASTTVVNSNNPVSSTPVPSAGIVDTKSTKTQVRSLLDQMWQTYKGRYIQGDGRVSDPQRDASTSEGESYAMLRAFWQNDRATFDNVLNWSINNLQSPRGDKLFAYLWGKSTDNTWKVQDRSDATDADQDIAFALLLANTKWNDSRYLTEAKQIMNDLWTKTIITINGKPYMTGGDWGPGQKLGIINPSYFMPYEYRAFAQYDPDKTHNWLALLDAGYDILNSCTTNKLDSTVGKLPPNWCGIDKQNGTVVAANTLDTGYTSDYGYDAFRTMWRLALDYQWNGEKRALTYLQSMTLFPQQWKSTQKLAAIYDHAGNVKDNSEDLGIYSGSGLSLFTILDPALADQMVTTKLIPRVAQDIANGDPDPAHIDSSKGRTYYAQNWVWFGLALYADALPNPQFSK